MGRRAGGGGGRRSGAGGSVRVKRRRGRRGRLRRRLGPACAVHPERVRLSSRHRGGLPVLELEAVHLHVQLRHLELGRYQLLAQLLLLAFHLGGESRGVHF